MNGPVLLLLGLFLWLNQQVLPHKPASDTELANAVRSSLLTGNASQLSAHFAKTIELVIDTEKVDFPAVPADHAELILRQFFRKYPPYGFQFVYEGTSHRLRYRTGTYTTHGSAFTVYVLMHQTANRQYVIHTLHFRKK